MRVKLLFKTYNIQPDALFVLILTERATGKKIHEITSSQADQLEYFFAMFKAAGYRGGKTLFKYILSDKAVAQISAFKREIKAEENDATQTSGETLSAHELAAQLSIITKQPFDQVIHYSKLKIDSILTAYERTKREAWEQTRLIAFSSVSPHLKYKQSPQQWLTFSWDKLKAAKIDPETYNDIIKSHKPR